MLQSHLVVVAHGLGQVDKLQEVQLSPAQTYWLKTVGVWHLLHREGNEQLIKTYSVAWNSHVLDSLKGYVLIKWSRLDKLPSEGISCKELAASGSEHLLKPGGENRHGDGVDDKEEEELDAII